MKLVHASTAVVAVLCSVTVYPSGCGADSAPRSYVFEAEALAQDRGIADYAGKGYGFAQPENEVGGWVTLQSKQLKDGAFVPGPPQILKVTAGVMAPGQYGLALRVVRWMGSRDWQPVPSLQITVDGQPHDYQFGPQGGALPMGGGVYNGDARWQWIELSAPVDVTNGPVTIGLCPAPGNFNYVGVLVDAVRFTPLQGTVPTSQNNWNGDVALGGTPPTLPGAANFTVLVNDGGRAARAETSIAAAKASSDYLIGWVRGELPLGAATVSLSDGKNNVDLSLPRLVKIRPLNLGYWYMVCLRKSDPALRPLDRWKNWRLGITAAPRFQEVRLQVSGWRWASSFEFDRWAADSRGDDTSDVNPPPEAENLRLNVAEELTTVDRLTKLSARPVEASKKVILWPHVHLPGGTPDVAFMRQNAARIKRAGIDGVVFSAMLQKNGESILMSDQTFSPLRLDESDFRGAAEDMAATDWKGLEGSLLRLNVVDGAPQQGIGIDWFDDEAWSATLEKVRLQTRLVKVGKLSGLLLDTEEYPPCGIFDYSSQKHAATRSFAQYADKANERGKQFAQACRDEYPGMMLMFTFTAAPYSRFRGGPVFSEIANSLLPAFIDGILQVDGITVVDGFEESYSFRSPRDFARGSWQIEDAARYSRDPGRYRQRMKKSFGLWVDLYRKWDSRNEANNYHSPANLENTLHWALRNSDDYVWLYTETLDWFGGIVSGHRVPSAAYDKAIVNSRKAHDPNWLPAVVAP